MKVKAVGTAIGLVLITLLAAGCVPAGISVGGSKISNGKEIAQQALTRFKDDNAARLQAQTATISEDSHCFFTKSAPNVDDVSSTMACGPIRRAGVDPKAVWDLYSLKVTVDASNKSVAVLEDSPAKTAQTISADLLVSADGAKPADPASLPDPQLPQATKSNVAAVVTENMTVPQPEFTAVKDGLLITPAANVEVLGVADLEGVPAYLEVGEEESEVDLFRPADGQRAVMVKLKAGPSTMAVLESLSFDSGRASLNTEVSLRVGETTATLVSVQEGDLTATCQSIPCTFGATREFVVMASVPSDGTLVVAAQVNGETQTIELPSGQRKITVSDVSYSRSQHTVNVTKTINTKVINKVNNTDYDCTWTLTVEDAIVTPFDGNKGWAPAGKAWLGIAIELDRSSGYCYAYRASTNDNLAEITLTVNGATVMAALASRDGILFEIPGDATTVTLAYTPKGTFTGNRTDTAFTAPTVKLDINLPK